MAQVETPWPINVRSDGKPSSLAEAPVAMISAVAWYSAFVGAHDDRSGPDIDGMHVALNDLGAELRGLRASSRPSTRVRECRRGNRGSSRPASSS